MSSIFGYWGWVLLYFAASFFVPRRKLCRGLFTRYVLARIIPPRSAWLSPARDTYRYLLWLAVFLPLMFSGVLHGAISQAAFFGSYVLMLLDDYFFGDDEWRKKLLAAARNAVKWKMRLPTAARHGGTA